VNDLRKLIYGKLLSLGEDFRKVSISELNIKKDSKDNVIKGGLLTFDYSKQRIDRKVLDYLLEIPDLINLKESLNTIVLN
jgi:hypothetical protein